MAAKNPVKKKSALGRGLGALLQDSPVNERRKTDEDAPSTGIYEISLDEIQVNPFQPRSYFDKEALQELSESILVQGIIQPITVRKLGEGEYQLISGERRFQASKLAGLTEIPAYVRTANDQQMLEMALIENIQRQDLNPIEEAAALEKLMIDHQMTQEHLSKMIGRSRPAIANTVRLLGLSEFVKSLVVTDAMTAGHARALLSLPSVEIQDQTAKVVVDKALNVRQTEALVKTVLRNKRKPAKQKVDEEFAANVLDLEHRLRTCLGTKVSIQDRNKRGKIVIDYYSYEELDRILEKIGV